MDLNDSILVTGGNGFIGSHLIDTLIDKQFENVYSIDNLMGSNYGELLNINKKAKYLYGSIDDYHFLENCFQQYKFKYIFHIAANGNVPLSNDQPFLDFNYNALGSLNIFNLSVKYNIQKIIFASTAAVYGIPNSIPVNEDAPLNPISNYGLTKLYGEKLAIAYFKTYSLKASVIRIFNTYGPRQPRYVLYDLIKKLHKNNRELEVLGTGDQVRDYAFVSDTVNAFIKVMKTEKSNGEIYNISGGNPLTIKELVRNICLILKIDPLIKYTGKSWPGDITVLNGDISKLKRDIDFSPEVSITTGLEITINWFKENGYL